MRLDNPQLLAALARLNRNDDFAKFRDLYLAGLMAEQIHLCIEMDAPARAQGAAMVLQQIQKDVESAEAAFLKLTETRELPLP